MIKKVKVTDRYIGEDEPCFVIAEIGANHNNDVSQAKELVDVAIEAGVDAIKLQLYSASNLWPKKSKAYPILKSLETDKGLFDEIDDYCKSKGMLMFASPFDVASINFLEEKNTALYKWASSEIFDLPLLKYVAKKNKPILIATGVSNLSDIEKAVTTVKTQGNEDIVLLHCVSAYPTQPEDVHLRMMDTMRTSFQLPVGFSDHTLGISVPIAAVARGACVIEKHYTLSRKLDGLDHKFALEPKELIQMVKGIRDVEKSLGSPIISAVSGVEDQRVVVRLFAGKNISMGTKISKDMLTVKRDKLGVMPEYYDIVLGRNAKSDISADTPITWDVI